MTPVPHVDVVGVGLNATDTLIHLPHFPARGSKVEYEFEDLQPGGQVASAMVACQTWGLSTRYVGKLGDDEAATLHAKAFRDAGVEAQTIHVPNTASARSVILVDQQGERTVLCRREDKLVLQPGELRREWITEARALLVDGHDTAAAITAATWAQDAGIPVIADLDAAYPDVEVLLGKIDHLVVSRDFPAEMTGETRLPMALQLLQRRYGCAVTAATLGTEGVVAWDGKDFHYAAAYQVPTIDTTGAGDIFHAAYVYALLKGLSLGDRLELSCAAAARNCMAQGAWGGIRSVAEIRQLMSSAPRYETAPEVESIVS